MLGLERTSPFTSSLLIAMVPLFTMVILALRGEPTPAYGWAGLAVALGGVVLFLADQWQRDTTGSLVGAALSLGAGVMFALYGIVNRPLVRDYPPATYTAYTLLAGSLPLLAVATPAALAQDWGAVSTLGWIEIVYMVILPVYVAYMLWNWAIARRGAAAASSFSLLVPVVSGSLSAWLFDERFGAPQAARRRAGAGRADDHSHTCPRAGPRGKAARTMDKLYPAEKSHTQAPGRLARLHGRPPALGDQIRIGLALLAGLSDLGLDLPRAFR